MEGQEKQRRNLLHQFLAFVGTSGIGWLIDFSVYCILTGTFGLMVRYGNFISATPATTFVFFVSTRKNFINRPGRFSLRGKYVIYIVYQFVLVLTMSNISQFLFDWLMGFSWMPGIICSHMNIVVKIMITPVTMIMNFLVMKNVIEKF